MNAQANAAPVIIKRKKFVAGGGHHGGAWKVAYADFVTAMMAFFMLMWLLNATTEQQRKGIADYFSPTIPINRVSGGGNGAFGGDSIFSQEALPRTGTGATSLRPTSEDQAKGATGADPLSNDTGEAELRELESVLLGRGGESLLMENTLRHVVTRLTDEGLVIELFELDEATLFQPGTDQPTQLLRDLISIIAQAARNIRNDIALAGHVRSAPIVLASNPVWNLSVDRATQTRNLLQDSRIPPDRIRRVTGHADRSLIVDDPMSLRNNRVEIILLRDISRN